MVGYQKSIIKGIPVLASNQRFMLIENNLKPPGMSLPEVFLYLNRILFCPALRK